MTFLAGFLINLIRLNLNIIESHECWKSSSIDRDDILLSGTYITSTMLINYYLSSLDTKGRIRKQTLTLSCVELLASVLGVKGCDYLLI